MIEYPHILATNLLVNGAHGYESLGGTDLQEDAIYRLAYLTDRSRLSKWCGVGAPSSQRIRWEFTEAVTADTFVLDRSSFLNTEAVLTVQYSETGDFEDWHTVRVGEQNFQLSTVSEEEIYWTEFDSEISARYWSVRLDNVTTAPIIFNLWLGKRIELTFGPTGTFDPYQEELVGDSLLGAAGGFQRVHRYRRRVLSAFFSNLTDDQANLLQQWWREAGRDGRNWWWVTFPRNEAHDALYLNCESAGRRFGFENGVTRSGSIEAREVV
jgi:hypothetical protein